MSFQKKSDIYCSVALSSENGSNNNKYYTSNSDVYWKQSKIKNTSNFKLITKDIDNSTTFVKSTIYVIKGIVRVLANVKITIENGTNIYIMNGPMRSSLIFNTGSSLDAKHVYLRACDSKYNPVKVANNGGLWFLGSSSNADKDKIFVRYNVNASSFTAIRIVASYLGRSDPKGGDGPNTDDIDGISVLGVGSNEWNISSIVSYYSGDDGFDVENSAITLKNLRVVEPKEDGLNITSSRVNILNSLEIDMGKSKGKDRDIFDLEPDEGQAYVRLEKGCNVNISGVFGDQLKLVSKDLPQPDGNKYYTFTGKLAKGQTYVYAQKICNKKTLDEPPKFPFLSTIQNIVQHVEILKNII
jgi:hypothetical protein